MNSLDLLLHPVRLRIIHAMSGGRTCTTSELSAGLPDVSKATLYRHVALLVQGGLVEVASEQRVRGAVERRYRLDRTQVRVTPEAAASMSLGDHRRAFASAVAALIADFDAYLDQKDASPFADLVGYTQVPLWLDRDELGDLINAIRAAIRSKIDNPARGRRLYMFSPILFPITEGEQFDGEPGPDERPARNESRMRGYEGPLI